MVKKTKSRRLSTIEIIVLFLAYNTFMFMAFFIPALALAQLIALAHYGVLQVPITLPVWIVNASIFQTAWMEGTFIFFALWLKPKRMI